MFYTTVGEINRENDRDITKTIDNWKTIKLRSFSYANMLNDLNALEFYQMQFVIKIEEN